MTLRHLWRRNGLIWAALMALLLLSFGVAYVPVKLLSTAGGLVIAVVKAALVVFLFMELAKGQAADPARGDRRVDLPRGPVRADLRGRAVAPRRPVSARATAAAAVLLVLLSSHAHAADETVSEALCRMIESASAAQHLPVPFLTRLIWQESSFRPDVTSRAGAQGVAQFMPGTARERGLSDPFDPEQAIPAAAALITDLKTRFGNLGLAAAAYNGGTHAGVDLARRPWRAPRRDPRLRGPHHRTIRRRVGGGREGGAPPRPPRLRPHQSRPVSRSPPS